MSNVQTPLVIFVVESQKWCFANIAAVLQLKLAEHFRFKIMQAGRVARETCDVLVCFWWDHTLRVKANVKTKAVVTCLYDELSWHINDHSKAQFKLVLRNTDVLAVCNEGIAQRVRDLYGDLTPEIMLIEDGVDTDLFKPTPLPVKFSLGWTGNSKRHTPGGPDDLKGLSLIKQAAASTGTELRVLDASAGGSWPLSAMPKFYDAVSAVIIGSAVEGTPNPLLESMACGRPVISTRVGLAPKVISEGKNGFLVERSVSAMANAISQLASTGHMELQALGRNARATGLEWSWDKKSAAWRNLLQQAIRVGERRPEPADAPRDQLTLCPVQVIQGSPPAAPRKEVSNPPKVLAISDVRGWAFHVNMMDMAQALEDQFDVDHWFIEDWVQSGLVPDFETYDTVFCIYHRWGIDHIIPWDRTVGSLRAQWFWPENQEPPGVEEYSLVNQFRAFHVVTKHNYDELKSYCPDVMYLTNPVNMKRFPRATDVDDRLVASWNGNAKHYSGNIDVKGFYSIILPAVCAAQCEFVYAEYNSKRLAPTEMPAFYQSANVALCLSTYEGASNSTMEAMASGLALITTDCGNHREMRDNQIREYGESGIIILESREASSVVEELNGLQRDLKRVKAMGELNRTEIETHWSWDVWAAGYATFLRKGCQ